MQRGCAGTVRRAAHTVGGSRRAVRRERARGRCRWGSWTVRAGKAGSRAEWAGRVGEGRAEAGSWAEEGRAAADNPVGKAEGGKAARVVRAGKVAEDSRVARAELAGRAEEGRVGVE